MAKSLRVACLQFSASENPEKNLIRIHSLFQRALLKKPDLVALPENFYWRGPSKDLKAIAAQTPKLIEHFQQIAQQHQVSFLLGSVLEASAKANKFYSTSVLISEKGKVTVRYRKIHLFKIALSKVKTDESRSILRGKKPVLSKVQGVPVGLSICYDLRFPELYRHLAERGAKILLVPANFTFVTGEAHWEVLLRARAIENQAFVIAPAQTGIHPSNKIKSFGTSLILDPWGRILAQGSRHREEVIWADLDLSFQKNLRKRFPVLLDKVL